MTSEWWRRDSRELHAPEEVGRIVADGAADLGVSLRPADLEALRVHFRTMMRWRSRADLTALVDPREIGVRHYLDSLTLAPHLPSGAVVADLGSGAGFPGVPLAIARPDIQVTLLETREVKLAFLHHVVTLMRRANLHVARTPPAVQQTAEGGFDFVVARAVADATQTLDRCAGLVKQGGQVWLMRGPSKAGEPDDGAHPPFRLAGEIDVELPFERLPRRIVMYQRSMA